MKRLLVLGLGAIFALTVVSTGVVFAVEDDDSATTTTTETQKALAERIDKRKAELKTQLKASEKARLKSKCKASQGSLSSLRGRIKGIETSRGEVYKNMVNRLTSLSEKLENKGVDTTELDAEIVELQTKIDTFNTELAAYKLAVSDLADMDCEADPDGFKASLETARAAREKVSVAAKAVRAHLQDTIKPLLKSIRAQLEADQDEGED